MAAAPETELRRVLITGANGFVGRNLSRHLAGAGLTVRASQRGATQSATAPAAPVTIEIPDAIEIPGAIEVVVTGDLNGASDWRAALRDVDAVIHCAARVHILEETAADPLQAFRDVNVAGTANLARQAADAGVKQFLFLSSIGARLAQQAPDATPYQISKLEAEQALRQIAAGSAMTFTILRPPLIYGADAPGNFALLTKVILRGLPLPLASVENRRAFLYVGNLCDAVLRCLERPAKETRCYELADGPGVSTPDLVRTLAGVLGRPPRLWPCPVWLLRILGRLTGRRQTIERLTGSLEIDLDPIRQELDWSPPWNLQAALAAAFEPGPADTASRIRGVSS